MGLPHCLRREDMKKLMLATAERRLPSNSLTGSLTTLGFSGQARSYPGAALKHAGGKHFLI